MKIQPWNIHTAKGKSPSRQPRWIQTRTELSRGEYLWDYSSRAINFTLHYLKLSHWLIDVVIGAAVVIAYKFCNVGLRIGATANDLRQSIVWKNCAEVTNLSRTVACSTLISLVLWLFPFFQKWTILSVCNTTCTVFVVRRSEGRDTGCDTSLRQVAATNRLVWHVKIIVAAICHRNSNWFEFVRHIAATK